MKATTLLPFLFLLLAIPVKTQDAAHLSARSFRQQHEHKILQEFIQLLSVPNIASDRENIRRNAFLIMEMMRRRQSNPRLLKTRERHSPPVVYGEYKVPGAKRTIVLYAHYDGQPTNPKHWIGTQP